jgi:hypothetical protein
MPSILEAGARAAINPRNTDEFIELLTIAHADITTRRFANYPVAVSSRGNSFEPWGFETEFLSNSQDIPTGKIRIANIAREIWAEVEALLESPTLTIEFVLASDPETVVDAVNVMRFQRIVADAAAIEGEVSHRIYADEPYPAIRLTPQYAPYLSF